MRQLSKDGAIVSPRDAPPPKESRFEPTNEFSAEPRHMAEPSVSPVNGNLLTKCWSVLLLLSTAFSIPLLIQWLNLLHWIILIIKATEK